MTPQLRELQIRVHKVRNLAPRCKIPAGSWQIIFHLSQCQKSYGNDSSLWFAPWGKLLQNKPRGFFCTKLMQCNVANEYHWCSHSLSAVCLLGYWVETWACNMINTNAPTYVYVYVNTIYTYVNVRMHIIYTKRMWIVCAHTPYIVYKILSIYVLSKHLYHTTVQSLPYSHTLGVSSSQVQRASQSDDFSKWCDQKDMTCWIFGRNPMWEDSHYMESVVKCLWSQTLNNPPPKKKKNSQFQLKTAEIIIPFRILTKIVGLINSPTCKIEYIRIDQGHHHLDRLIGISPNESSKWLSHQQPFSINTEFKGSWSLLFGDRWMGNVPSQKIKNRCVTLKRFRKQKKLPWN